MQVHTWLAVGTKSAIIVKATVHEEQCRDLGGVKGWRVGFDIRSAHCHELVPRDVYIHPITCYSVKGGLVHLHRLVFLRTSPE